jgi:hypothetical protein
MPIKVSILQDDGSVVESTDEAYSGLLQGIIAKFVASAQLEAQFEAVSAKIADKVAAKTTANLIDGSLVAGNQRPGNVKKTVAEQGELANCEA